MSALEHAVEGFLGWCRVERNLSVHTLEAYHRDLSDLGGFLTRSGHRGPDTVRRADLQAWLAELTERGLAESTVARRRAAMRQLFAFLVREKLLEEDPTARLAGPKARRKLPTSLSEADVEALLGAPDHAHAIGLRDAAMLTLMYATGLRVSELVLLRRESWHDGWLIVRGKGGKDRLVPYGDRAGALVARYLSTSGCAGRRRR